MTDPRSTDSPGAPNRATQNRLGAAPRPAGPARLSDDDNRTEQIAKLVRAHRGDVAQQIDLAEKLQREFERNAASYPRTRRAAATELLRVWGNLKALEKKAARDRSGRLLTTTPFDRTPRLWTRKGPHNVEEIAPFSPAHVERWKAVGDVVVASRPLPVPAVAAKPKPAPAAKKEPALEYMTIKVPGMTLASAQGRALILAAVIRLASRQAIAEAAARKIAASMDLWMYFVFDFEDTVEHATKAYDALPLGWSRLVKLRREFLPDLQKLTSATVTDKPVYWSEVNDFAREYLRDFSSEERSWYVIGRLANKPAKDARSGYRPGQIVNDEGVLFVGPEVDVSLFYTPDGRLFGVPEKSVREQQLDAVVQGAKWARGGVILGYGIVAVGAVALAAPALVAGAAEVLASGIAAYGGAVTAVEAITFTRYFVWLTFHWQAAFALGSAIVALGVKLYYFSPRAFVEEFKKSPKDALLSLGYSVIETMHDFGEAYVSMPSGGHGIDPNPRSPAAPARQRALPATGVPDESPVVVAPKAAPTTTPAPTPVPPVVEVPESDKLVRQRMTGNALQKTATPANDDGKAAPAVVTLPQAAAKNDQVELMQQRTGTDNVSIAAPTQPAGGTVKYEPSATRTLGSSGTRSSGAVNAARGTVSPAPGTPAVKPATSAPKPATSAPATKKTATAPADEPHPDAAKPAKTVAPTTHSDDDDVHRGTLSPPNGRGPIVVRPPRVWTPSLPPNKPNYANRDTSVAERIRFIDQQDAMMKTTRQGLSTGQRRKLDALKAEIARDNLTDDQVLGLAPKPNAPAKPATKGSMVPQKPEKPRDPLKPWEETVNKVLREDYKQRLEEATKMKVIAVAESSNVGDQAADDYARSQGRPHAFAFTTVTKDGQHVQVDDFDFVKGQPIEHKSIRNLVPPHLQGQARDGAIHTYVQQLTKQAAVARYARTAPFRWVVPVDVEDDFVAQVLTNLPAGDRKYIEVARGEGYF